MIALLARAAVAIGVPDRFKRLAACAAIGVLLLALVGGTVWWIHRRGSEAGAAKVTAQVARRDEARRVEVRTDERLAAGVSAAVGATAGREVGAVDAQLHTMIKEIDDAFAKLPPQPAPGGLPPAAPVDELRAAINAGTERANRAAGAAGAQR